MLKAINIFFLVIAIVIIPNLAFCTNIDGQCQIGLVKQKFTLMNPDINYGKFAALSLEGTKVFAAYYGDKAFLKIIGEKSVSTSLPTAVFNSGTPLKLNLQTSTGVIQCEIEVK